MEKIIDKFNKYYKKQQEQQEQQDPQEVQELEQQLTWHKLTKDPNDLPKDSDCYLIKIKSVYKKQKKRKLGKTKNEEDGRYNIYTFGSYVGEGEWEFDIPLFSTDRMYTVIAWMKFDFEE